MSNTPKISPEVFSVTELLGHALLIELEAVQNYKELADQMRQSGNIAVAALFEKMSALEAEHVEKIREKSAGLELPHLSPWEYRWQGAESPETIGLGETHYLMTPHHALKLALRSEEAAQAFFEAAAEGTDDVDVRSLALELAEDERQHVVWMRDWLAQYPQPDTDWDHDPDPPKAVD